MRCFIAIDIDEEVKKLLSDLQRDLRNEANVKKNDVKWVNIENMHLTLKFLGEVTEDRIVEICDAVKEIAGRHKSFELGIKKVGFFGSRSAKVLWVGTDNGTEKLCALQKEIESKLQQAGWPRDNREFSSHLTLCRVKNFKAGIRLAEIAKDYENFEAGGSWIDSVSVYQSQLKPTGPVYTVLAKCELLS